jgi:sulfur-oxidizing protein SoxA
MNSPRSTSAPCRTTISTIPASPGCRAARRCGRAPKDRPANPAPPATERYPKFNPGAAAVINLEQRVNLCRRDNMGASPWTYGSDEMLSMSAYLRLQSRGLPMSVRITGEAQPVFERGRTLYNARRGALGISCALCHDKHYGKTFSGKLMSQGQSNGFPTYHRDLKQFFPLHVQFSNCRRRMKAEPAELGSQDYVALELYLAWRGAGLPMEAPSVRR